MRILTWNINGVRASKIPLKELFDQDLQADIICLQETKVTRDQLDERSAIVEGYNSYFSFSKARSGYSGVATYTKDSATPVKAEEGLSGVLSSEDEDQNIGCYGDQSRFSKEELEALDKEGRAMITQHKVMTQNGEEELLTIINVYCPRADPEKEDRKTFKLQFYDLLQTRAEAILAQGSHVIILGDVNSSHQQIDHCDPSEEEEFKANPGRQWLDQFLWRPDEDNQPPIKEKEGTEDDIELCTSGKFVDTFRYFHPAQTEAFTCWSTVTGARATNYGTRIDYIFGNVELTKSGFTECILMPEIEGSDHCPVKATLKWEFLPNKKCPSLCTKYMPEFTGKQQKLLSFFTKAVKPSSDMSGDKDSLSSSQGSDSSTSISLPNPEDSNSSKGAFKKASSEPLKSPTKKQKIGKQASGVKQSTLVGFFGKSRQTENKTLVESTAKDSSKPVSVESAEQTKTEYNFLKETEVPLGIQPKTQAVASWKNLLKGPMPAPPCKGHREPCVLRTVKKDGLNQGRQFFVCARPEGHKSNKDARCEHFEWVEKKKKKSKT